MIPEKSLSRREYEVMEILHRLGRASAAEVREALADPPTDAAVRSVLRILGEKGHVAYFRSGPRYVYSPTVSAKSARRLAVEQVVETFFDGSTEGAMAALLETSGPISPAMQQRLKALIDRAASEGR